MKLDPSLGLLVLTATALLLIGGCGQSQSAPPPTAQEKETSSRMDTIYKGSGGDWDKVSAADKAYLIQTIGHGSETTAKMIFGPKPSGGPPSGAHKGPQNAPGG